MKKIKAKIIELDPNKQYVIQFNETIDREKFKDFANAFKDFQKSDAAKIVFVNANIEVEKEKK